MGGGGGEGGHAHPILELFCCENGFFYPPFLQQLFRLKHKF